MPPQSIYSKIELMRSVAQTILWCVLLCACISIHSKDALLAFAQQKDPEVLKSQIDDTSTKITQLRDEIARLQSQLTTTSSQKQTLQNAVSAINLNIKKLEKSITLTKTQIGQTDSEIYSISKSIATTSTSINYSTEAMGESLRQINAYDAMPLGVLLLSSPKISSFFAQAREIEALQIGLKKQIHELSTLKINLEGAKQVTEHKRSELAGLQDNLNVQQHGLSVNKDTQTKLLVETKSKETTYQAQIAQKKRQEKQFESDLAAFETQLKLVVNLANLPTSGTGALMWPVDNVRVTQYFGNTPFATANPQVYGGGGHNAIDLAAPPGTPIKSARKGVILGTGNTDSACPGASYGKWIFIKHDNGLSTIYAHLSAINVSKGSAVETNETIGLSGTTGYATGPHLHFGVYASDGAEIASFPSKSCAGKIYTMPVADVKAYLNPLTYLPKQ